MWICRDDTLQFNVCLSASRNDILFCFDRWSNAIVLRLAMLPLLIDQLRLKDGVGDAWQEFLSFSLNQLFLLLCICWNYENDEIPLCKMHNLFWHKSTSSQWFSGMPSTNPRDMHQGWVDIKGSRSGPVTDKHSRHDDCAVNTANRWYVAFFSGGVRSSTV